MLIFQNAKYLHQRSVKSKKIDSTLEIETPWNPIEPTSCNSFVHDSQSDHLIMARMMFADEGVWRGN